MIVILACVAVGVILLTIIAVFLVKKRRSKNRTSSLEVIPEQYSLGKIEGFGNGLVAEK